MANFAFRKDPFGSCVGCRLEGGKAEGTGKGGSDECLWPSRSSGSKHGRNMEWLSLRKRSALLGLGGARKGRSLV